VCVYQYVDRSADCRTYYNIESFSLSMEQEIEDEVGRTCGIHR
jgi:hypothetical protein